MQPTHTVGSPTHNRGNPLTKQLGKTQLLAAQGCSLPTQQPPTHAMQPIHTAVGSPTQGSPTHSLGNLLTKQFSVLNSGSCSMARPLLEAGLSIHIAWANPPPHYSLLQQPHPPTLLRPSLIGIEVRFQCPELITRPTVLASISRWLLSRTTFPTPWLAYAPLEAPPGARPIHTAWTTTPARP